MTKSLKIAVADDELDMRDFYRRMLVFLGHRVTAVAQNGRELVEFCRAQPPDLIITDVIMPEMDGIDAATAIWRHEPAPVIVASSHRDAEAIRRLESAPVMAFLIKPISRKDLGPMIDLALLRFDHFQQLRRDAVDLAQALIDRRVVEQAKQLLLKSSGGAEADAFQRLQTTASASNCKVVDAARMVLGVGGLHAS